MIFFFPDFIEMMMMQNVQMHQMVMQQMMLSSLPGNKLPGPPAAAAAPPAPPPQAPQPVVHVSPVSFTVYILDWMMTNTDSLMHDCRSVFFIPQSFKCV